MLLGSVNVYCTECGCSVDTTQLMQPIAVGCLVMRAVGTAAVSVVIMSAQVCPKCSLISLTLKLCNQCMFLWPSAVDRMTEHRKETTNIPLSIL
jgi:hypothetical protein